MHSDEPHTHSPSCLIKALAANHQSVPSNHGSTHHYASCHASSLAHQPLKHVQHYQPHQAFVILHVPRNLASRNPSVFILPPSVMNPLHAFPLHLAERSSHHLQTPFLCSRSPLHHSTFNARFIVTKPQAKHHHIMPLMHLLQHQPKLHNHRKPPPQKSLPSDSVISTPQVLKSWRPPPCVLPCLPSTFHMYPNLRHHIPSPTHVNATTKPPPCLLLMSTPP